ncbi:DUF6314 family protein [uncultured Jatrophihabitans sp.]|uniref:DUF6314 family protein n=1 Tax=uncultured Jatrophihabitans sp. TaxID=1610747 RepID=UPI0035C9DB5E
MTSPAELAGTWRLGRRVHDRRLGAFGTVTGTLTLEPADDGLRWLERGRFLFAGQRFDSSRELLLTPDGHGGGWTMRFADGGVFHPWRPGEVVTHPCRADMYRGLVDVAPQRLRILWDVTGPAKDQRLVTRCTR